MSLKFGINPQPFLMPASFNLTRLGLPVLLLLLCMWGFWNSARIGYSRLWLPLALVRRSPAAANRAVSASPNDPEAHFTSGLVQQNTGNLPAALREYERAAALRPRDYYFWLILGDAREQAGELEGSLAAYQEAVRLAPFYSQPRWQFGNFLFRVGRYTEAFAELRRAAESNPTLLPAVIDLAWGSSRQDAQMVEQIIQPQTDASRLALARFFAKHGEPVEALKIFRSMSSVQEHQRRDLLDDLISAKHYLEAFEVWLGGNPETHVESRLSQLIDGGFEKSIRNSSGFGWQMARNITAVKFSVDQAEPREGARSLMLEWNGDSNPSLPVISQLMLVEPKTRYKLHFSARTKEVVTGGLPLIVVNGAGSGGPTLAQSNTLPQGTQGWSDYTVDFTTGDGMRAVLISLQRQPCTGGPCPIFGRLWLDAFTVEKLSANLAPNSN